MAVSHSAINLSSRSIASLATVSGPIQEYGPIVLLWLVGIIVYVTGRKKKA